MPPDAVKLGLPASIDAGVRVLVLGSLPGERSLAQQQYYAQPTNQFWKLLGGVIGGDLHMAAYPERMRRLLAAGIGLWDVIGSARRTGSLDGRIRGHAANDLASFVTRLPALRAIGFNGGKAATIGRKQLVDGRSIALVDLPSSSAAYCSISLEAKLSRWLALRDHLGSLA